ncbi:MAG TPA: hypothetical protein VKT78_04340 [Fimbriimonadaceae bacterium]|nr:hypothetical protein [Fimbriimonadaceae bacterium]
MRRLLDPAGTLGTAVNALSIELIIICAAGLAMVPLSLVIPARFSVTMCAVFIPVQVSLGCGLQSLKGKGRDDRLLLRAITGIVLIFAAGMAAAWIDYKTHVLPEHLGMSRPVMGATPCFRVLAGLVVVAAFYCGGLLVLRARQVSLALRGGALSPEGEIAVPGSRE